MVLIVAILRMIAGARYKRLRWSAYLSSFLEILLTSLLSLIASRHYVYVGEAYWRQINARIVTLSIGGALKIATKVAFNQVM